MAAIQYFIASSQHLAFKAMDKRYQVNIDFKAMLAQDRTGTVPKQTGRQDWPSVYAASY